MIRRSSRVLTTVMLLALAGALVSTGCSEPVAMPVVEELGTNAERNQLQLPVQPPVVTHR